MTTPPSHYQASDGNYYPIEQMPGYQQPPPPKKQKQWYGRWWVWVIAFFVVFGFIGAITDSDEPDESDSPSAVERDKPEEPEAESPDPEETEPEPEPESEPEPDYSEFASEVREQWLAGYGLSSDESFGDIDFGEDDYTLLSDITEINAPDEGHIIATVSKPASEVDKDEADFIATGQKNIIDHDELALLEIESSDGEIVGSSDESKHRRETDDGLTIGAARVACQQYAKREFPYGVKMHWLADKQAERVQRDDVFFKVGITVTNAFKAKEKGVLECTVEGSEDSPRVSHFLAY